MYETRRFTVRFVTPAFLGNAEQRAQWRTPPFKALLRQWWRVAKSRECDYDWGKLLQAENVLFGAAAKDRPSKSQLRLRLKRCNWANGAMKGWIKSLPKVQHPEVGFPVAPDLYLGYGPLVYKNGTCLKEVAIAPGQETADLLVAYPRQHQDELEPTFNLAAWFGSMGSRSRNGWGSLRMDDIGIPSAQDLHPFSRTLDRCLLYDWPHAIGEDGKGLLAWTTEPKNTWGDIIRELAGTKIAFRTQFSFSKPGFSARHILAYPVTDHKVAYWEKQTGRLASQIRFKVSKVGERYIGLIVHLPCKIPDVLTQLVTQKEQEQVWQKVHRTLDSRTGLFRLI
jgi:CRISPR-associated protein Cmr1